MQSKMEATGALSAATLKNGSHYAPNSRHFSLPDFSNDSCSHYNLPGGFLNPDWQMTALFAVCERSVR